LNWGSGCGFYFFTFCYFLILEGEGGHEFFFLHLKRGGRCGFIFGIIIIFYIFLSHFLPPKKGRVAWVLLFYVATPLLKECEDDTHTLEMGT
jgi:hypothetical protein